MRGHAARTPERVARAIALRAEGWKLREIAGEFGVSLQAIHEWVTDPDGAKRGARKARYRGSCERCGGPTDGSDGPGKASKRCLACEQTRNAERNARIVAAWEAGDTLAVIAEREGMTVSGVGTWINLARQRDGMSIPLHRRRNRELWPYIQLRWNLDGATGSEIAAEVGTSRENIWMMIQAMRNAGWHVKRRAESERAA